MELSPLGGRLALVRPCRAMASAARLAMIVEDAASLQAAHELLTARGVRTELAYELDAAAAGG